MYNEIRVLYDKNIALGIDALTELVSDLNKKFRANNFVIKERIDKNLGRYGFEVFAVNNSFFIGMYWELWEYNGYPFVIAFSHDETIKRKEIDNFRETSKRYFGKYCEYIVFEELPTICIKHEYFNTIENIESFYQKILSIHVESCKG